MYLKYIVIFLTIYFKYFKLSEKLQKCRDLYTMCTDTLICKILPYLLTYCLSRIYIIYTYAYTNISTGDHISFLLDLLQTLNKT